MKKKEYPDITLRCIQVYNEWKGKDYHKTYRDFGELIGVTHTTVYDIMNNKRKPSQNFIHKICDKLNYQYEWVNFGTGDKKAKQGSRKLIDIQKMQQEITELKVENRLIRNRMAAQDKEIEDLKEKISQIFHGQFAK